MSSSDHHPPPLSSDEIIQLAYECRRRSQNNIHQPALPSFLLTPSSHFTLLAYLHDRAASSPNSSTAVSEYVASLLSLSEIEDSLTSLLPSLLQSFTSLFTSRSIPHDSHSSSVLQLFSTHLNSIPTPDLVLVVDSIISYLSHVSENEDTQILILLPECLNLIRSLDGVKNRIEYTNSVLDKMLECGWCKVLCVKMAAIIQDFLFLDKTKRSKFLVKVVGGMRDVDLQDLLCLVKQLLVLASKGFGKREVIEGIVMLFGGEEMDAKDGPMMRQVVGTVLLYMNSAVEEDPELGNEILGVAKLGYSRGFNHFSVGVLLSISRVKWFNRSAIGVLKSTLFGAYNEYTFAKECKWLADDLREDYFQHARAIEKAVLRAVKESTSGREHILPSIIQLGFKLLAGAEEKSSKEINYDYVAGPEELGSEVLKNLFELHDAVRNEIIYQCIYRILSSKPEVMAIIRLLGHLVLSHPKPMLDHTSLLEVFLDSLGLLDSQISSSLINVLWPLMKCSRYLQDCAIMALRKATSGQEYSVRLSAAAAIVELLLAEKRSGKDESFSLQNSSNQACSSQKTELRAAGVGLFQELSCSLQRCLCQQARVREIVYHGLLKLVLIDPSCAESVLNFLLPRFQRFFTKDAELLEIINCVKIENGEFFIEEPIDCLLFCISWIRQLFHQHATDPAVSLDLPGFSLTQENEARRNLASQRLSNGFLKIRDLIRTKSLSGIFEDFNAKHTLVSEQVSMCYLVFLGIIEVTLNNTFFELEKATGDKYFELMNEFSDLVCRYECAEEETSEDMQKRAVKRGLLRSSANYGSDKLYSSCTNLQERSPCLKTSCILQLLLTAVKKLEWDFQDKSAVLCNLRDLLTDDAPKLLGNLPFILKICMRQLDFISFLAKDDTLKIVQGNIHSFGSPLLKVILLLSGGKSEIGQRKTERKDINIHRENIQLALVCLKKLITISLCSLDSSLAFNDLLSVAGSGNVTEPSWDNNGNIHDIVDPGRSKEMFIEKIIKPILEEFLGLSYFHVAVICDIVTMIANTMAGEKKKQIGEWATSICRSTSITNPEVAKCMVSLIFSLASPPIDLLAVQDMSTHLLQVVGAEKAAPLDTSEGYAVINKDTCAVIATSILEFIESIVDDMNRVIKKLRPCIAAQNEARALAMEEPLYRRAEATVLVLSSFVQMNLKDPQAEQFLRITAKFYKSLARIVKLLIACKGGKQILQSTKYRKLEDITWRQLTAPLRHLVAQKPRVELYELRNESDGADTKGLLVDNVDEFKTDSECILGLIFHMQDYQRELIRLRMALLRAKQPSQGSGTEDGSSSSSSSSG